ncbi:hypothetical protein CCR75_003342 [Bremia lactucae]|uniref:Uncharacterized protein n=1 Tax=Bremia lactucae TaxID=4779 RepID=A0A976ICW1_BRELC|nr:hypothetical protein CCR75_003342 [Bremia lactucae]
MHVLQMGINDANNTESSQLLEHLKLSGRHIQLVEPPTRVIPLTRARSKASVSQKRAHSTTPAEKEQARTRYTGETIAMENIGSPDLPAQLLETRDSCPELWEKHRIPWPASARTASSLERSSTEALRHGCRRCSGSRRNGCTYYRGFHFRESYWGR